ncbi:MAG: hypothetical protein JWP81_2378 [Ferruginibacter sp.]|nr:hypothetical protein [Ferruginibacter sp.]
MISFKSVIPAVVLLFCTFYPQAQDRGTAYKDSATSYTGSTGEATTTSKINKEVTEPESDLEENNDEDEYTADTLLKNNQLFVERDSIRRLKSSKPFAYAKNLDSLLRAYQQKMDAEESNSKNEVSWLARFFNSSITKYFFWTLAGFFVCFILYQLFFTEGFFQRSYARSYVTVLRDEAENLTMNTDYAQLIAQAVSAKNYRIAVRYHYLQSLQKLASKGAIQYAADKTNYEYVSELSGKPYKKAFTSLTLHYEYVWYGGFDVNESVFSVIQNKFIQFNSEVKQ